MKVTFNFGSFLSARSVAGDTIIELGQKYNNVWALTADTGGALKQFKKDFPDRYIDVGVAEQNLAGIAAGLALEGNIPFISGMIPFMTMRACEQNRTAICYQDLPVRFIGTGGGLTSGGGSTHNAMEDISIMKSLVNMTVLSIGDPNMVRDIMLLSMTYPHPLYLRLAQGKKDRMLYEPGKYEYKIGMGLTARDGKDATIIAHGEMVFEALEAANALAAEGIDVRVIDMYSIKPVDKDLVLKPSRRPETFWFLRTISWRADWPARLRTYLWTAAFIRKNSNVSAFRRYMRASAAVKSCEKNTAMIKTPRGCRKENA